MQIFTKIVMQWDGHKYVTTESESFDYCGPVELCCGATAAQNNLANEQSSFFGNAVDQAQQIFGKDSTVFNSLMKTFAPTVAAGPSQQGFSAGEKSNLDSQAITQSGQAYKNAKAATGNAEAAQGGGMAVLPGGAKVGADANLAISSANNTANELGQINQADYDQGNKNYNEAVSGMAGASNVFNSATGASEGATGAGSAAASTANQVSQENQSWVQSVTGALGGIAGAAAGNPKI